MSLTLTRNTVYQGLRHALTIFVVTTFLGAAPTASARSPYEGLGVYAGSGTPAQVGAFENSLESPVAYVHDFLDTRSTTWAALTDPSWWLQQWGATNYGPRVIYSIPMLPDDPGVSLAAGATGAYNDHFRTLAQAFVAGGRGNATLRLGWEFNGDWFRWSIKGGQGPAYAAFWRQIVTTMRSVPGANFKFDWCVTAGSSGEGSTQLEAETAWPGSQYVDYIGADVYDQSWIPGYDHPQTGPQTRWNGYLNARNGLNWQRNFALQMGKPMTFPEWGISRRADGHGGGDAPYFIERMYYWMDANNVAYNLYFEFSDDDSNSRIFSGATPLAADRFVLLFKDPIWGGVY